MEDPAATSSSLWASLNSWFTSSVFFILLNLMIATIVFTSNLPNNEQHNHREEHDQQQQQQDQQQQEQKQNQHQITRSPSIIHRLKSFNFYPQKSHHQSHPDTDYPHHQQHPLELAATQYVFNQPLQYQHFDHFPDQIHETQPSPETRAEHVTSSYDSDQTVEHKHSNEDTNKLGFDTDTPIEAQEHEDEHEFESLDEVYSRLKRSGHDRTQSDGSIGAKPPAKMKKSASLKVDFTHLEEEIGVVEARRPATGKQRKPAGKAEHDDDVEVDSRADDFINKFKNDLKLQRIESIMRTKGGGK